MKEEVTQNIKELLAHFYLFDTPHPDIEAYVNIRFQPYAKIASKISFSEIDPDLQYIIGWAVLTVLKQFVSIGKDNLLTEEDFKDLKGGVSRSIIKHNIIGLGVNSLLEIQRFGYIQSETKYSIQLDLKQILNSNSYYLTIGTFLKEEK